MARIRLLALSPTYTMPLESTPMPHGLLKAAAEPPPSANDLNPDPAKEVTTPITQTEGQPYKQCHR